MHSSCINNNTLLRLMGKKLCSKCHHPCHCGEDNDLHADEYGVCTCEDCNCKRTYKKQKDHGTDITYENEVK